MLSLLIFIAWVMALMRTILNLALVPRLREREPRSAPLVSVLIPARNEERTIGRTVRALLDQTWTELEIVVVNDRSDDATGVILEGLAAGDPRLVVVNGEEPPPGWLGKPWALHQASRHARGELLLFVDADIVYAPGAVAAAVAELEESGAPMISLLPHIEMRGFWEHIVMPNLAISAFTVLPLWISNRTRVPLLGVGGGPGNFVRRDVYEAVGGHESLKDAVIDDIGLARLIRRSGHRTVIVRATDYVSVRMYHGLREIIDGFTKNTFAAFGRSYVGALIAFALTIVLHLLPYALAFTGDPWAIAAVGAISLTRLVLFVALGYRIDNALLGHPLMMSVWTYIIVRSAWYTGARGKLEWRGRTYDARSTRFGAGP